MEPDHKPSKEHQRRLSDAMRKVVKEVLRLLHVGVINPMEDSDLVMLVQVNPKEWSNHI